MLRIPNASDIPGADFFGGDLFHSARWNHDVRIAGRRVAVIGTGSTGVQLVGALGGVAGHVTLFQRTPQWIAPMGNTRYRCATRAMHRRFPMLSRLTYDGFRVGAPEKRKSAVRPRTWPPRESPVQT